MKRVFPICVLFFPLAFCNIHCSAPILKVKIPCSGISIPNAVFYALIVGNNANGSLSKAELDAHNVESILSSQGYTTKLLVKEGASHDSVIFWLKQFSARTRFQDRILFYFAGHGEIDTNKKSGYMKKYITREIYGPAGCPDTLFLMGLRQAQGKCDASLQKISALEVVHYFNTTKALQWAIILDACHGATFVTPPAPEVTLYHHSLTNRVLFLLTGWNKLVEEEIYTPIFLDAISGNADLDTAGINMGKVDAREAKKYIEKEIMRHYYGKYEPYSAKVEIIGTGNFTFTNWRNDRKCWD